MSTEQEARIEVLTQLKAVGIRVGLSDERLFKNAKRGGFRGTETDIANAVSYLADKDLVEPIADGLTNERRHRINSNGIDYLEQNDLD